MDLKMISKPRMLLCTLPLTLALLLNGCATTQKEAVETSSASPKNVILMVGDGMGYAYLKAYRLFKDDPSTPEIDLTLFDKLLSGSVSTDSDQALGLVTDSAAAATTYATGYKTKNGAIGVDKNDKTLKTVLEYASENQRGTGLVASSHINHATPAAFIAHVPSRLQYADIANQFFDNQHEGQPRVDVILGGGVQYFKREDRDIVSEFAAKGYEFLADKKALQNASSDKLLGLFAKKGLAAAWDRDDNTPSLADMSELALTTLNKNDNGFFLMIEGSQIDWAGHGNDILYALSELEDFEQALARVLAFIETNPDTLLIVTADHETGGLSLGAKGHYGWDVDLLRRIHTTSLSITKQVAAADDALATFTQITHIEPNEDETKQLLAKHQDLSALQLVVKAIVDRASFTGWTTGGHTGVDVPLMATGAGSDEFKGLIDNTVIGQRLIELIQR